MRMRIFYSLISNMTCALAGVAAQTEPELGLMALVIGISMGFLAATASTGKG